MEHESLFIQNIDELLSSLPACRRCRLNKRRCDTELPSCRNCSKAGAECIFFDNALQDDIPRAYVSSLIQRLQQKQQQGNNREKERRTIYPASVRQWPESTERISVSQASRYLGPLSCLSQSLSLVNDADRQAQQILAPPTLNVRGGFTGVVNHEVHKYLVTTYFKDIHCLYPFLDESLPFLSPDWFMSSNSSELAPWKRFILELVYSIACHHILDDVVTDHDRYCYRELSDECYRRSLEYINQATTDTTMTTLQSIILLALHSLFAPQKGNFGQLIGFAARLAMDLGIGDKQGFTDEEVKMQRIHASIYCMENQFATTMDRPGFLPEPPHTQRIGVQPSQVIFCSLCRIQSRYRCNPNDQEATEILSQQVVEYIDYLEREPNIPTPLSAEIPTPGIWSALSPSILALAHETRLLIHPNDAPSAARLLAIYTQPHYVRTFLSSQWAYRAGVVVVSEQLRQENQLQVGMSWRWSATASQAYGNCLIFLEQVSRRWPSAGALKRSLQSFVSSSLISRDSQGISNSTEVIGGTWRS